MKPPIPQNPEPLNCPREYDWLLDRMVDADIDYQKHEKNNEEDDDDTES